MSTTLNEPVILGDFEECSVCQTPTIYDSDSFHPVCPVCGLVGPRCRYYFAYKFERTPPEMPIELDLVRLYENGQRTRLGQGRDYRKPIWERLRFLNKVPINRRNQHLRKAIPEIYRVAGILGFSRSLIYQISYCYIKAYNAFKRFGNIRAMVLAACYIVIRRNEMPISLGELVHRVNEEHNRKKVQKYITRFRVHFDYQMPPINVLPILFRYGEAFNFPFSLIREAVDLYHWCKQHRLFGGHNPWVIAAGILYLLGKTHKLVRRQREVGTKMYVSDLSLRDTALLIKNALKNPPHE